MIKQQERTCFVIMPYGGEDKVKKDFYKKVYTNLILPSCRNLEFSVSRQDENPNYQKKIVDSIFDSLMTYSVVIADISELKWNIAFEAGFRTGFQRMCSNEQKYNIIFLFNRKKGLTKSLLKKCEHIMQPDMQDDQIFKNTMTIQEFRQTTMEHFYAANSVPFMINQDNCIDYSDEDVMAAEATKGELTEVQIKIGTALRQLCADDSVLLQKSRTDNMASVPAEQAAEKNSHDEIILSAGSISFLDPLKNIISLFRDFNQMNKLGGTYQDEKNKMNIKNNKER